MTTSRVSYLGDLRTKCTHVKSGTEIITDAPVDNNGKGSTFSPTDLAATSYASCMLTIIGIFCNNHDIEFKHGEAEITKIMGSGPRRISKLVIDLDFSGNNWDHKTQLKIKNAGENCPVAITLKDNVEVELTYNF
ncbi:Uncharacterized OsmC-related protein [Lishizhenia tianjinensis]|uniref:Uncharacterized OsmC-related protein n=1 Tax=Lishizhenia tianjinensis TaxID=477690 RepID=A0A1I6YMA3_9FLAO|nr:OsmC family protein [Lishizhenia tianjinensis]SFT51418.1 Uncharacterized OsmC-related protein [Lishizhenia tianjinensis]